MLKRLSYLVLMLYFLGVATGGISVLMQKQKDKLEALTDEDGEKENMVRNNLSVEEDVICHEIFFTPIGFKFSSAFISSFAAECVPDVSLSLVAPPPEVA